MKPQQVLVVAAVALSLYQLWQPVAGFVPAAWMPFEAILGLQPATYFRPVHLGWILALGFIAYPLGKAPFVRLLDWLAALLAVWASYRIVAFDYQSIDHLLHGLATPDLIAGVAILLLTLEVARRTVGLTMLVIGCVFIAYSAYGYLLPDVLANRGFSIERIVRFQVFTGSGLYGTPIGIAGGAVFMFVLFGALLKATGAGQVLIDLAFAAAGRYRGGPAKASVLASAAMGSISGSAIANTVTTGSITIPMMKDLGYSADEAAGIEASASTGGQIMPPIMGAGAFVMADFTGTAYADIVWMSLVPALLYFTSVMLYVHVLACKHGIAASPSTPAVLGVLIEGAHFLLPIALITALLITNYSPVLVGSAGCLAVVVAAMLRTHTRIGFRVLATALKDGALMAVPISAACAVAGVVVGVIGQTGIGLQFTESVVDLAGERLWLALGLVALAALVLGMGLPATAAYIVLAVMAGPALQEMGITLIVAHMVIFWLSQTSNITPPIALAAFAAAGIAGAKPMSAAMRSFRFSNGFFVIPLMMVYSPLLLVADTQWSEVLLAGGVTFALIVMIAVALEGYLFVTASTWLRLLSVSAAALLVYDDPALRALGTVLAVLIVLLNFRLSRK
ncbi:MAG: TRAP transporter fused permease subunit [Proteobacteria bacterium]|nr:TRAP transporter fused permease subunit [Pseudomonadota bacterium]